MKPVDIIASVKETRLNVGCWWNLLKSILFMTRRCQLLGGRGTNQTRGSRSTWMMQLRLLRLEMLLQFKCFWCFFCPVINNMTALTTIIDRHHDFFRSAMTSYMAHPSVRPVCNNFPSSPPSSPLSPPSPFPSSHPSVMLPSCSCCCCSCLLQIIIRRDRPLANIHPDGPASCKWSSRGTVWWNWGF